MPVVIADASPLVSLSLIHRLDLLQKLFGTIQVVQAVMQEVLTGQFAESEASIRAASKQGWLETVDASMVNAQAFAPKQLMGWMQLDAGEAQSIAYAASVSQKTLLLMDERAGKQLCDELGLATLGTAGILLSAKNRRLIPSVRPELERLHQVGFWLSPAITKQVLTAARELP
jgi:predicted nucleic acid-binding protein